MRGGDVSHLCLRYEWLQQRDRPLIEGSDVLFDEPCEPRAFDLALLHDDAVELGMVGGEVDEIRDHQAGHRLVVHPAQPGSAIRRRTRQVPEQLTDRRPPQLLFVAEVVGQQRLLGPGPLGDERVLAPRKDRSENRSRAAARILSRVSSAEGRCARAATAPVATKQRLSAVLFCRPSFSYRSIFGRSLSLWGALDGGGLHVWTGQRRGSARPRSRGRLLTTSTRLAHDGSLATAAACLARFESCTSSRAL